MVPLATRRVVSAPSPRMVTLSTYVDADLAACWAALRVHEVGAGLELHDLPPVGVAAAPAELMAAWNAVVNAAALPAR